MKKPRAYICIDASNSHYYLKKAGWQIDWVKFKAYCEDRYESPEFFYYEGVPSKGQYFDNHPRHRLTDFIEAKDKKLNYFKFLKQISFKVRQSLLDVSMTIRQVSISTSPILTSR